MVILLFSDASALNLKNLRKNWALPTRLLAIGLPITIFFTFYAAKGFFPEESAIYLLLLALVLAPTDAALGKAVVSYKKIPENIRSTINAESGLNDGIVFPILITVVVIITSGGSGEGWMGYVFTQISMGAIIGAFVGFAGAKFSTWVISREWMEEHYQNLVPIALAIFSYYLAEYFGGNGFIAAFFSGLFLGNFNKELRHNVEHFVESEGELLIMICFLIFGISILPTFIPFIDLTVLVYSILSLTILRMVPVAISLLGISNFSTMLFIGWFGPRGIASILYMLIISNMLGSFEGHERIFAVMSLTVLLSIFLHGLSAKPLANLYVKRINRKNSMKNNDNVASKEESQ